MSTEPNSAQHRLYAEKNASAALAAFKEEERADTTSSDADARLHPPRIRARHVLILGGLAAFGPLSTDMYLTALPAVSQELGAPMALTQLTLTVCIFGLALGQVFAGPISDARGRRVPLLIGGSLFVLLSLLCSVASSVGVLIGLRFVQGLAGAAGVVIALAVARDLYAGATLARAVAMLMTVNFLAPAVAPVLGGQLLRFVSWRGIFVALALISGACLLAAALGLRETLPPERRRHAGGVRTALHSFRTLLADGRFRSYALICGFSFAAAIVYISASPFVLQHVYGLSPQRFSLAFGVNALALAMVAQLSARLVDRVTPGVLLMWGVVALALASGALPIFVLMEGGLVGILLSFFVLTASLGLIAPNATALALADQDAQSAGSASAVLGVFQLSIGAVVAPLVGVGGSQTGMPMAVVIAAFGVAALLTVVRMQRTG